MGSDSSHPLQTAIAELIADGSLSPHVQQLLQQKPYVVHFRRDLERCFHRKRAQEFSTIFRVASFLWAILYLSVMAGVWLYQPRILDVVHYPFWGVAIAFCGLAILSMTACAFLLPRSHDAIHRYIIGPLAGGCFLSLLLANFAYPDHHGNIHASYNLIIAMILISFSMRLPWHISTAILLTAGGIAEATLYLMHWQYSWLQLAHACVLIGLVLSVVAFFVERRERLGFLHEVQVAITSRELEQLNNHLATLAREDALCQLANRRAFDDLLNREWERARREEQPLALLFIDVDFFKHYNDTYGHSSGDDCLRQVAAAIRRALLRPADIAARYGGEEFVVLLAHTDIPGACEVAERIIQNVDQLAIPHGCSSVAAHVTVSVGINSVIPGARHTMSQFLNDADQALYRAKHHGRHQCVIAHPAPTHTPYQPAVLDGMTSMADHG